MKSACHPAATRTTKGGRTGDQYPDHLLNTVLTTNHYFMPYSDFVSPPGPLTGTEPVTVAGLQTELKAAKKQVMPQGV